MRARTELFPSSFLPIIDFSFLSVLTPAYRQMLTASGEGDFIDIGDRWQQNRRDTGREIAALPLRRFGAGLRFARARYSDLPSRSKTIGTWPQCRCILCARSQSRSSGAPRSPARPIRQLGSFAASETRPTVAPAVAVAHLEWALSPLAKILAGLHRESLQSRSRAEAEPMAVQEIRRLKGRRTMDPGLPARARVTPVPFACTGEDTRLKRAASGCGAPPIDLRSAW